MNDHLQDSLLMDDGLRHPMWTEPEGEYGVGPRHDLKVMLARHLKRFDGRPNSETILAFFKVVYELTDRDKARDTAWLIGQIIHNRYLATRALQAMANNNLTDRRLQASSRSQTKAIESLTETFVNTIVKYV